jgi:hypothetical protein
VKPGEPRRSVSRWLLALVLISFGAMQAASAAPHSLHQQNGSGSHGCVICHLGHLPADGTSAPPRVETPTEIEWVHHAKSVLPSGVCLAATHTSRGPPA